MGQNYPICLRYTTFPVISNLKVLQFTSPVNSFWEQKLSSDKFWWSKANFGGILAFFFQRKTQGSFN